MTWILGIESSCKICSVSLGNKEKMIDAIHAEEENIHSKKLHIFIKNLLDRNLITPQKLNAVALSQGPGSFTGLRIGTAMAKALAFSLNIPLIAINTLKALAFTMKEKYPEYDYYLPVIDAHIGEAYYCLFNQDAEEILPLQAGKIDDKWLIPFKKYSKILIYTNVEKLTKCFSEPLKHITIIENGISSGPSIIYLAYRKYTDQDFVDISTFEPLYLKDFKAKKYSQKLRRILST
jgi:tRNA threonylcarbamoyladenosine biosynthesis protein TsaB